MRLSFSSFLSQTRVVPPRKLPMPRPTLFPLCFVSLVTRRRVSRRLVSSVSRLVKAFFLPSSLLLRLLNPSSPLPRLQSLGRFQKASARVSLPRVPSATTSFPFSSFLLLLLLLLGRRRRRRWHLATRPVARVVRLSRRQRADRGPNSRAHLYLPLRFSFSSFFFFSRFRFSPQ